MDARKTIETLKLLGKDIVLRDIEIEYIEKSGIDLNEAFKSIDNTFNKSSQNNKFEKFEVYYWDLISEFVKMSNRHNLGMHINKFIDEYMKIFVSKPYSDDLSKYTLLRDVRKYNRDLSYNIDLSDIRLFMKPDMIKYNNELYKVNTYTLRDKGLLTMIIIGNETDKGKFISGLFVKEGKEEVYTPDDINNNELIDRIFRKDYDLAYVPNLNKFEKELFEGYDYSYMNNKEYMYFLKLIGKFKGNSKYNLRTLREVEESELDYKDIIHELLRTYSMTGDKLIRVLTDINKDMEEKEYTDKEKADYLLKIGSDLKKENDRRQVFINK